LIQTLTLPEAVALVGLYCTVFLAVCKLIAHFHDQYERALERQKDVGNMLFSLIAEFDAKLRQKVERKSEIKHVIVEGKLPELREEEYGFLREEAYREVIANMAPEFVRYARTRELARWLPSGFLWLWRAAVAELVGMFLLFGAVVYEVVTRANWALVYQSCVSVQGTIAIAGFALYVFLMTRVQQLYAVDKA